MIPWTAAAGLMFRLLLPRAWLGRGTLAAARISMARIRGA
jgi:hypothetical protein